MMVGAYSRSINRKKVSENTIKILEIESLINEGNFTNEVKALYQEKIQTLINANNAIINESVSEIENLK
jgi:hypothetical protein